MRLASIQTADVHPRITYSHYLVDLVARAEAASARLGGADPTSLALAAAAARREASRLSARLDGSPLQEETADAVDTGRLPDPAAKAVRSALTSDRGSWAHALRLEGLPTREITAVEYANLLTCFDAEVAIAEDFFDHPREALTRLHRLICQGLVNPLVVGAPRVTAQAVHDGAQGKMIYRAPPPETVPALLDDLVSWLGRYSAPLPTLIVAGVVHERLLEWQPFEAANGRLARATSRVVLRARGLDPHGLSVPEREFCADPIGYYGEVAATARRGDLGLWLERFCEASLTALERAADAVDPKPLPGVHKRALMTISSLELGEALTIAEYAERAGTSFDTARSDLRSLACARLVSVDAGTRGLRYRRSAPSGHHRG
jgi:hypothetical protein